MNWTEILFGALKIKSVATNDVLCRFYFDYMYMRLPLIPWSIAGVPSSRALPYHCTSTCVRSWCNWRADCVATKQKKNNQDPLQEFLRAGRFRASLLLRTTCVCSCCNLRASCVATKLWQQNKKKLSNKRAECDSPTLALYQQEPQSPSRTFLLRVPVSTSLFVRVCFLLYLSVSLWCARCFEFCSIFITTFISNSICTCVTVPIYVHIALPICLSSSPPQHVLMCACLHQDCFLKKGYI